MWTSAASQLAWGIAPLTMIAARALASSNATATPAMFAVLGLRSLSSRSFGRYGTAHAGISGGPGREGEQKCREVAGLVKLGDHVQY